MQVAPALTLSLMYTRLHYIQTNRRLRLEDGETHQSVSEYLEELLLHINGVGPTTKYFKVKGWSKANFAADKVDCKPVSRCVLTTDGAIIL